MFKRRKTDQAPGEGGPQDLDRYRRAWHSYVARRNLVVVLFLSFIFLGFLIGKLKLGQPADFGIMLLWIVVYLAVGWLLTVWRRPRRLKVLAQISLVHRGPRVHFSKCLGYGVAKGGGCRWVVD